MALRYSERRQCGRRRIESASDVLASGLVLFGLNMAAKPPDAEHPYGHGRLETLSGMAVGLILAATGSLIAYESLAVDGLVRAASTGFDLVLCGWLMTGVLRAFAGACL